MNINQRLIFRWIHIIFSIPILGYIYSPFRKTSQTMRPQPGLSSFLPWSLRDCGCGKAISFEDLFRRNRPDNRRSEPMQAQLDEACLVGFSIGLASALIARFREPI